MDKAVLFALGGLVLSSAAFASSTQATDITNSQIQKVIKQGLVRNPPAVDQTLRVFDMGNYQFSVAVIHRGPIAKSIPFPVPANAEHCGLEELPQGAKEGPDGMFTHDDTAETYIIISGSGTLVTGGKILNGARIAPDDEITTTLNGPSCTGRVVGDFVSRHMGVGDVSVIPAGVPHGWTNIGTEVTYLSVRPDPDKVLEHEYVNPAIRDTKKP